MLQTFQALFRALRTASTAEARSLSRVLCFYVLSSYFLAAIQAAIPNFHNFIVILGFTIIGANAFQLFRIGRLIRLTAVGETLELTRVIPNEEGITANKLIGLYWDIAVQLFVFMAGFCLLAPHLPLQREWWLAIAWPTLFIFIAILFGAMGRAFLRIVSGIMLLFVIATVLSATFPQIDAQLHLGFILKRILPSEVADDLNDIFNLREKQKVAQIKNDLEEIRIWVEEHPNTSYPKDYRRFLKSVSNGDQKNLSEIRAEILWEKESPPPKTSPENYGDDVMEPNPLGNNNETAKTSLSHPIKKIGVYLPKTQDLYLFGKQIQVWVCPQDGDYNLTVKGTYKKWFFNSWVKGKPDIIPTAGLAGWGNDWEQREFSQKNYGAVILAIDDRIIEPGEYFIKAGQRVYLKFNFVSNDQDEFWDKKTGLSRLRDNPDNRLTTLIRLVRIR